jgi:mono/diheme cytochrome c family protein
VAWLRAAASAPVRCYAVASDGVAVFVGVDTASSTVPLRRIYRGGQPRMVRRVTQTGLNLLPYYEVVTTDREGGQPVAAIAGFDGRVGALRLGSAQTHLIDISPIVGTPTLGAAEVSLTATPPYINPNTSVSVTLQTVGIVSPPPLVLSSPGYALTWTITAIRVGYYRQSSSNTINLYLYHQSAVCLKCHAVAGTGGNAAPALDGVASRGDARYLLHSLVNPSESIAKGYENAGASAMPAMGPILSDAEIRDAVAYLKTLK